MCRLILTSRRDFNKYDRLYGVPGLMDHLEKQCGGHGNGYALVKNGKIFASNKGVKLTNSAIYAAIQPLEWDYLIWHTRIKSSGLLKDDLSCHPFIRDNDCIAMNGTEYELEGMAQALGIIDTQVIFRLLTGLNIKKTVDCLSHLSSVFIGTVDGIPYAVNAGGSLHRWGKTTFHASTFPNDVKSVIKTTSSYMWLNGMQVASKKATTKQRDYDLWEPSYYATKDANIFDEGFETGYQDGFKDGQQEGYNQAIAEYIIDH